jgi:hypothetical protein
LAVLAALVLAPAGGAASRAATGAVYTETNGLAGNAVVVFDRYSDGTLTWRQTVPTGGLGSTQSVGCGPGCPILDSSNAVVVSNNGHVVVAVNAGSDTITSFRETNAGLEKVATASSGGDQPESLALHNDLLYVLNVATANANGTRGNVYGFRLGNDGSLTPIGSSQPLASPDPLGHDADPRAIGFNSDGTVLVATELAGGITQPGWMAPPGGIDTFVIGSDGSAGPAHLYPTQAGFPFGFAFDNKGTMVNSELVNPFDPLASGATSTYAVSDSGVVTPIDSKTSGAPLPCWVAIPNSGRYAYTVNTGAIPGQAAGTIAGYKLSPSGSLTSIGSTAAQPGEFAITDETFSRDSKYLYVLSPQVGPGAPSHIDAYRAGSDGSLTFLGSAGIGAGSVGATGLAAS